MSAVSSPPSSLPFVALRYDGTAAAWTAGAPIQWGVANGFVIDSDNSRAWNKSIHRLTAKRDEVWEVEYVADEPFSVGGGNLYVYKNDNRFAILVQLGTVDALATRYARRIPLKQGDVLDVRLDQTHASLAPTKFTLSLRCLHRSAPVVDPLDVDLFIPGAGAGAVTVPQLQAGTYGTALTNTAVTVTDPADLTYGVGRLGLLRRPIRTGGNTIWTGAEVDSHFSTSNVLSATHSASARLPVFQAKVWTGFMFNVSTEPDFATIDICIWRNFLGGVYTIAQWRSTPTPYIVAHSNAGTGPQIPLEFGVSYWAQMVHEQNVAARLAVWRMSDWALMGTSTLGLGNDPAAILYFPTINAHGATSPTGDIKTGMLCAKWTGRIPDYADISP